MERSMIVLDNFIQKENHVALKNALIGLDCNFPWFYNSYKLDPNEHYDKNSFQFTHTFYNNYAVSSAYFNLLIPILEKLNPSALIRIKANLNPRTEKNHQFHFHTDIQNFKGKTAVYYVNSTDGNTVFQDGKFVECVENRIVIFDSTINHAATTCTNEKVRCVLNFNFYEWSNHE